MTKFSAKHGDIEPRTKRIAVRTEDFAASDLNGDVYAYNFNPKNEEFGLDPWRIIDGVDPHVNGGSFDLWGESGFCKTVGPDYLIFINAKYHNRINSPRATKLP